jgi:hypothetical protein
MPVLVRRYGTKVLVFGLNIALQLMVVKLGVLQWLGIEPPPRVIIVQASPPPRPSAGSRSTTTRRPTLHTAAKRDLDMP